MKHLGQVVRQVERRSQMDLMLLIPVGRSDLVFEDDSRLDVVQPDLRKLPQSESRGTCGASMVPIDVGVLMRHGHKDVKRALVFGS